MTPTPKIEASAETTAAPQQRKAATNARPGPRKPRVAIRTGKSSKKARSGHTARKVANAAEPAPKQTGVRPSSKTEKILILLKRPQGATLKDIMKATDWQPHSVRGFLSGTLGKRMGLALSSDKDENGERAYSLKP